MGQVDQWTQKLTERVRNRTALVGHFELVTHMFNGDGEQIVRNIRPPSIKGMLRFWWRALRWGHCWQASGEDANGALTMLHREEGILFGLAVKEQLGGQGLFTLSLEYNGEAVSRTDCNAWRPSPGTQYLLGQGLYRGKLLRDYLPPAKHSFKLSLFAHHGALGHELWPSLEDALLAFGLLGGLGSRTRRGLGSVSLTTLEGSRHTLPQNREEYLKCVQSLLFAHHVDELPPFTACSKYMRLDISDQGKNPLALLNSIGSEFQLYRSWGSNGKTGAADAERNFPDDHHHAFQATQGNRPAAVSQRAIFGLPHNYFFSGTRAKVDISVSKDAAGERRASPLLIHIHGLPDETYLGVQLLMPAKFLPGANPQLNYKPERLRDIQVDCPDEALDWGVIHRFMDRFSKRSSLTADGIKGAQ